MSGEPARPATTSSLGDLAEDQLLPKAGLSRSVMRTLGLVEQVLGTSFLVLLFVLVLVQVAQRYLPGGWAWTGEVARLALVWSTFSLAGYLMAVDRHIAIQMIDLILPRRALDLLKLMVHIVLAATCVGMSYASFRLVAEDIGQRTPAAGIPLAWTYLIPMIGFALTALRATLAIALSDLPGIKRRDEAATGPDEALR